MTKKRKIKDKNIIERIINKNNGLLSNWYSTITKCEDFYNYLSKRFTDKEYNLNNKEDAKEVCLRIINKIDKLPICPICGKIVKNIWLETCGSQDCMKKLRQQRNEEANLQKYGVKNQFQRKEIIDYVSSPEIRDKVKKTFESKYGKGVTNCSQVPEIQEKRVHTFLDKYGVNNAGQIPEVKEKVKNTIKENYGVDYYFQTEECRDKRKTDESLEREYKTKRKNGTLGVSKIEKELFEMLKEKFPNAKHQYRSEKYPFNCDYYVPELDLYIEYQGFWTHGDHPYNPESEEDKQKVQWLSERISKSGMYSDAIHIWTLRDPLKRQTAKENNLNWIEFFTPDQFYNWLHNYENKN